MTIRFQAGGLLPPNVLATPPGARPGAPSRNLLAMLALSLGQHVFFDIMEGEPDLSPPSAERIDLRDTIESWPVRDQGATMTCVAYAVGACIELQRSLAAGHTAPYLLSAGYLYWAMRRHPPPGGIEGWDRGGTRSDCAVAALEQEGICPLTDCPDVLPMGHPVAIPPADLLRLTGLRQPVSQVPGAAAIGPNAATVTRHLPDIIVSELQASRPVCLGFPIYPTGNGSTNWNDAGERDGTVLFPSAPGPHDHVGGHAVCVLGFAPDAQAEGGGWFLFRNSLGSAFGARYPIAGLTGNGYGRISAKDALIHCWDYFSLRPA